MTSERTPTDDSHPRKRLTLSGGKIYDGDEPVRNILEEDTQKIDAANTSFRRYKEYARGVTRARLRFDTAKEAGQPIDPELARAIQGLYRATSLQLEAQLDALPPIFDYQHNSKNLDQAYHRKIHRPLVQLIGNISECCFGAIFYRGLAGADDDDYTFMYASPSADRGRFDANGFNQAYDALVIRRETTMQTGELSRLEAKTTLGKTKYAYDPETLVIAHNEITPDHSLFRYLKLPRAIVHDALGNASNEEREYLEATVKITKAKLEAHIAARIKSAKANNFITTGTADRT